MSKKSKVQGIVHHRMVGNIADQYDDIKRVFLEYIDNGFDDADKNFLDSDKDSYKKEIKITLKILNNKIIIEDNCAGMKDLSKVVAKIGDSDKRNSSFSNGKFGFGMQSFLATSTETLFIETKEKGKQLQKISLPRAIYSVADPSDFSFDYEEGIGEASDDSGTKITFMKIKSKEIKEINQGNMVSEIEDHFESLLKRKNVTVSVINKITNKSYTCKPFNYDEHEGQTFEREVTELVLENKDKDEKSTYPIDTKPIKIFIKLSSFKKKV